VGKILYFYPYPRIKFHTHTLTYQVGYSHPPVKLQSPVADSDPLCRTVSMHCRSCCSRKVCTVVSTVHINELFMSRWIRTHSHSSLFRESREPLLFLREFVRDPCVWMLPLPSPAQPLAGKSCRTKRPPKNWPRAGSKMNCRRVSGHGRAKFWLLSKHCTLVAAGQSPKFGLAIMGTNPNT